jgi:hypothetical protein
MATFGKQLAAFLKSTDLGPDASVEELITAVKDAIVVEAGVEFDVPESDPPEPDTL